MKLRSKDAIVEAKTVVGTNKLWIRRESKGRKGHTLLLQVLLCNTETNSTWGAGGFCSSRFRVLLPFIGKRKIQTQVYNYKNINE